MVSSRRKKWVWVVLLLGACGVVWLLARQPVPHPPLEVRSPGPVDTGLWPPAAQTPVFEPIAAASEPMPAVPPAAAPVDPGLRQRSEWLSRLRLSTNLRAQLNEAQARPELGGLVLAQRIGTFCSEVEASKQPGTARMDMDVNHPLYARHQSTTARLDAWCSSLVGDENNGSFALTNYMRPGQPDPILNALNDLVFKRGDRAQALAAALQRFDPVMAHVLLPMTVPGGEQPPVVWFNGRRFDTEADPMAETSALPLSHVGPLAECAFGAPCTAADDSMLALQCLQDPMYCAASNRHELVQLMIYDDLGRDPQLTHAQKVEMSAKLLARAQSMADEVVRQIQARNIAAFMPR